MQELFPDLEREPIKRRGFLKGTAGIIAALLASPTRSLAKYANRKLDYSVTDNTPDQDLTDETLIHVGEQSAPHIQQLILNNLYP